MTNAAAVEMLKVFARLDRFPGIDEARIFQLTRTARDRNPSTSPVNSSTVSPFTASATNAPGDLRICCFRIEQRVEQLSGLFAVQIFATNQTRQELS